ncbi:MAG: hypothetical protein JNL19_16625 [Burkholderiales bacterium]|nr:hypothetical protein [Burkholderiales bacterium]
MFQRAAAQLKAWGQPHQLALNLSAHDMAGSSLYVHTPNPNAQGAPFPHDFTHGETVTVAPTWLAGLLHPDHHLLFRHVFAGYTWFVVVPKDHVARARGESMR